MTSTTRRTILAGLAAAPIAGLPAIAAALPGDDPVMAALAEHRRAKAALDAICAASASLSAKVDAARAALGAVTYHGAEINSLAQLERLYASKPRGMSEEDIEQTIADFRRGNAAIRAEASELDLEYEAARAALVGDGGTHAAALAEVSAAEEAETEPLDALNAAEVAIFEAEPTTKAGAAALIRFAADHIDEIGLNDSLLADVFTDAIRAAVAVLEGKALS